MTKSLCVALLYASFLISPHHAAVVLHRAVTASATDYGGTTLASTITTWSHTISVQGQCTSPIISASVFGLDNDGEEEKIVLALQNQTIVTCQTGAPCLHSWMECGQFALSSNLVDETIEIVASIGGDASLCSANFNSQTYFAYVGVTLTCAGTDGPTPAPTRSPTTPDPTHSPSHPPTMSPTVNVQALESRVVALETFVNGMSKLSTPLVYNLANMVLPYDGTWLCAGSSASEPHCAGWSTNPLHLKTNIPYVVGSYRMFNFEFRGQLLHGAQPIRANVVGYVSGLTGVLHHFGVSAENNAVTITYYKSSDSVLCFRITPATEWHASYLSINFRMGHPSYTTVPSITAANITAAAIGF